MKTLIRHHLCTCNMLHYVALDLSLCSLPVYTCTLLVMILICVQITQNMSGVCKHECKSQDTDYFDIKTDFDLSGNMRHIFCAN